LFSTGLLLLVVGSLILAVWVASDARNSEDFSVLPFA